ncbi:TauD/TfdA family dioxygenase [Streptomyces sp. NPDC058284]|uniref:TauD/TfdA family dioxygenase n=1 Tax=unclassified Streptomyces TaxID=2593676 RepID=UPI00364DF381
MASTSRCSSLAHRASLIDPLTAGTNVLAVGGWEIFLLDAYTQLRRRDPEATHQLTHDAVLKRTSTFAADAWSSGPAFAEERPGAWTTRYSRTSTDTYHALPGAEDALARAIAFMDSAAREGSAYRTDFTLRAGQALIVSNARIGHGRTAYRDAPAVPRLLRGLFTARPRA